MLNVQLRDPALRYPVFRAESRENFERLLRRDERNVAMTDFLPERNRNDDLRDLLMNGILTPDIRDEVRELFRQGEGNAAIGAYLSNVFAASDADTMTLEDGTEADFITSRSGFQAQVHGEKGRTRPRIVVAGRRSRAARRFFWRKRRRRAGHRHSLNQIFLFLNSQHRRRLNRSRRSLPRKP